MKLYRYENVKYSSGLDEFGNSLGRGHVGLTLCEFEIIKETPKGYWISLYCISDKKFVRKEAKKRYAAFTKEEAMQDFLARKRRQLRILKSQLIDIKSAIYLARDMIKQERFDIKLEPAEFLESVSHNPSEFRL